MHNNGYNSLLLSYPKRKFLTFNELKTRPKADFIAAPFPARLATGASQPEPQRNHSPGRCTPFVETHRPEIG